MKIPTFFRSSHSSELQLFEKPTLLKGEPASVRCVDIEGQTYAIAGKALSIMRLEEEWYQDVQDPSRVLQLVSESSLPVDIFTFWQRLPNVHPKFKYHMEFESIAALPIESYEMWWNNSISAKTRNMVRKATKNGVEIRRTEFADDFVDGITKIFNETPIRQGRPFWHYGRDKEFVRREFSRFLFREQLVGAYLDNELIGFIMLGNAGNFAILGQIISMISHRDKAPTNALIAEAVRICAEQGFSHLVYANWEEGSLGAFKRHNGFEKVDLPRYYLPLSRKGRVAMRLGLHYGWKNLLPKTVRAGAKRLRRLLVQLRSRRHTT